MARYKPVDHAQAQFIPISFEHQILPGSFEHALSFIVDNKLDFSILDGARHNDEAGAPAYDPRVMLKIVLYAYSSSARWVRPPASSSSTSRSTATSST